VERGDQVIHNLGDILRELIKPEEEFLGYMGEDDFVIITTPLRVLHIFEKLKSRFEESLQEICPEIAENFSIAGGGEVKISMGVVTNEEKQFGDPLQVKNTALEVLKNARNETGHSCANLKDYPV
ncbi:MAG: diguanylate cyclase, partial [Actinomycetota bacterium]|nr:diguanylate cyclase [Actinomycetota bacterium]